MSEFPWTYDQYQRYLVVKKFLEVFYSGKKIKVLDVGGLSPDREGKSFWLPVKHIHLGESYTVDLFFHSEKDYIQGDGCHLPFKDKSFDVVTAMDALEHIAEENRLGFIKELCRVSHDSVLLSAPFLDKNIIQTEKILSNQIQNMYGVQHKQLQEHAELGLPQIETVSKMLDSITLSNTGFSYGSLKNWIFNQTVKNCFLVGKNAGKIQALIDRWMASKFNSSEFEAPFSRHFWIGAKDISQEELEAGVGRVKEDMRSPRHKVSRDDIGNNAPRDDRRNDAPRDDRRNDAPRDDIEDVRSPRHKVPRDDIRFGIFDMEDLNREILDFYSRDMVSALVISSGETENLHFCLEHLLTQKVDFELEVFVWEREGSSVDKEQIKNRFPGVKFLKTGYDKKFVHTLLDVLLELKGNRILLLSQNILVSPDSVQAFYERLSASQECGILAPQIFDDSAKGFVWFGKNSLKKMAAGRVQKLAGKGKRDSQNWIFSECLFFERAALSERKIKNRHLKTRNLFLWEKERGGREILFVPELVVSKIKG